MGITRKIWKDGFEGPQVMATDLQAIDDGVAQALAAITYVVPVGAMLPYGGSSAPTGWLLCAGQALRRADYPELFSVLGTAYGSTSAADFRLPDLRGRVPVGQSLAGALSARGRTGGAETHTITEAQMPPHVHKVRSQGRDLGLYATSLTAGGTWRTPDLAGQSSVASVETESKGGGQPIPTMPPYAVVQWIIRAVTV